MPQSSRPEDMADAADPKRRRFHPALDRRRRHRSRASRRSAPDTAKKLAIEVAKNDIYTPVSTTKMTIYAPGAAGGDNWEPIELQPEDAHGLRVCGVPDRRGAWRRAARSRSARATPASARSRASATTRRTGTFTAIDVRTGKVAWQKTWPEPCYSGTATTAGNLVFVGRNAGQLQAYDATSGKLLWSFQTGAGANGSPTIFEQNGKEFVAFYAAGNSLQATAQGDSFWLFGLDGKLGPAAAPGTGTGTQHAGENGGTAPAGDAAAGKAVFADNCAVCHGALGTGGNGGPDLTSIPSAKTPAVRKQVTDGGGGMPPFKGTLTKKQIDDVSAYVTKNITNKK